MAATTTTVRTLYVHVVLNGMNFNKCHDIVSYAQHFLPVKFFVKYYLNELCFQLLQNIAWTDE